MKGKDPGIFMSPTFCESCKTENIEIFGYNGYPFHYKRLLAEWEKGTLKMNSFVYQVYSMRCRNCGREYHMYWDHGAPLPLPVRGNTNKQIFDNFFIGCSAEGRPRILTNIYAEEIKYTEEIRAIKEEAKKAKREKKSKRKKDE